VNRQTHVFLDELPWDMRSRNTDWRYVRFAMPQLMQYEPSLRLTVQRSPWVTVRGNLETMLAAAGRRIGFSVSEQRLLTSHLDAAELRRSGAGLVFAHRAFPLNAGAVPVVWQQAVLDPEMQRSYGVSAAALQQEIELKRPLFQRSAAVQLSTEAEVRRHVLMFPESAAKFVGIPFFTPYIQACSQTALERHWSANPVRILFVGNHALRKGLDQLLDAFLGLPADVQKRAILTVVSNFDRSSLHLPQHERVTFVRGFNRAQVMPEMRRSHIYVNVARFESYGLVFHEAMSQGLACLGPAWEVQRELFDDGKAGVNLPCDVAAIRIALEDLIVDSAKRYSLGTAAWQRYMSRYTPAVVAGQFAALFHSVENSHRAVF